MGLYKYFKSSRDGLPGLENDLDLLVTNSLGEAHVDSILLLVEGEAGLANEVLNVFKLGVVFVLVLDLLLKSLCQLGAGTRNHLN